MIIREGRGRGREREGERLYRRRGSISPVGVFPKKHSFKHPPNFVSELLLPEQTSKKKVEP